MVHDTKEVVAVPGHRAVVNAYQAAYPGHSAYQPFHPCGPLVQAV
jgi:hypothetical protein